MGTGVFRELVEKLNWGLDTFKDIWEPPEHTRWILKIMFRYLQGYMGTTVRWREPSSLLWV